MQGGQWITDNWKDLSKYAKMRHQAEWRELMVHFSLYVHRHWITFSAIPDDIQRIKFARTWFKMNVIWEKSDFNKSIRVNNLPEKTYIPDEVEEQYLDILAENVDESVVNWMIDVKKNFSEESSQKLFKVRKIYLGLQLHEKVLYDLYFTQMMSIRQIGIKIDLPPSAIHTMLIELKNKIKSQC